LQETYLREYSPALGKDMETLVFGHSGYPVIVFPTSMGRYYQNKDFKLIESVTWFVEQGLVKIYCPDSIDELSWYNKGIHPADRAKTHMAYDKYIREELMPKALHETGCSKLAVAGCSFGGYHAANIAFRYPELVGFLFCMGAAFDIRMQTEGYFDENIYYHNPMDFVVDMSHPELWNMGIVLGAGEHDFCRPSNEKLASILYHKGVHYWLDVRPGGVHDWPVWRDMFPAYLSQIK